MIAKRIILCVVLLCSLGAFAAPAGEAALPEGVRRIAAVEGITEYRLANGLRMLLFPDPSKETITVNITYLVGSRHEGYGESGMAHLLEHLSFKGTPDHPDIPQELTAHGSRPSGSTWFDRTNYHETFAATDENLDWALDLEADRMVNSFISGEDLQSEFSVVRNEFEISENYPQGVLIERMMSTAYLWHNYGRSTIGSRADIERVPIENLKAFYRTWYRPDNAVLVVAGRFGEPRTLGAIARRFGPIQNPPGPLPATYTVEPAQDGERSVTLRRVGDVQMVGALYHIPSGSHPDFAAVQLLAFILGDEPSGRLHKTLVEAQKASSVFGFALQMREPGAMLLGAEVRAEKSLDEARDAMLRTIDELAAQPPTAEEVERARENRLRRWETTMRNSERAAIELSEWSALGDWRLMFLHRDRIRQVVPEDVLRVARDYLRPENRTVGLYVPTARPMRAEIPRPPDVAAQVQDYTGGEALATGEAFDPSPEAIEARVRRAVIEPGLKLVMVPKKTRAATVRLALRIHFGDERSLQGRATAGELAGSLLMRGTKKRTRQEIQDEIDRLVARLVVDGDASGATADLETTRDNLAAALRLVAEVLREASFPGPEFALVREETLARLEDSKTDPFQIASTVLQKHLSPWPESDPRYARSAEEEIRAVQGASLDEIRRFHADFYGVSAAEACLVGDFDPAEAERLMGELFAGWKSRKPFTRLADTYRERPRILEVKEVPDKESAVMIAGLPLNLRDDAPEYPALVLGNFMLGGGFLNSRLAARIRQKEGISYGVGSYLVASPFDRDGLFGSYAIYAPQNGELLLRAFREEIAKVVASGFTPEEIEQAKQGLLQQQQVARATDAELAGVLARREFEKRTLDWDRTLEAAVSSLTNDQIVAALARHIDVEKISIVQAGDFAKVRQD